MAASFAAASLDRDAEIRGAAVDGSRGALVEGDEFVLRGFEADLEALDLAVPSVVAGFDDPLGQVPGDLGQARSLSRIDPEDGTSDTGVLVAARRSVRPGAGPEGHLAFLEVLLEFLPFLIGGLAVFR